MGFIQGCRDSGLEVVKFKKTLPIYLIESQFNTLPKEFSGLVISHGWGNGYVGIPKHHSLFGKSYDDIYGLDNTFNGLTFSGYDKDLNIWLFGFDTAHSWNNDSHDFQWVKEQAMLLRSALFNDTKFQRVVKIKKLKRGLM